VRVAINDELNKGLYNAFIMKYMQIIGLYMANLFIEEFAR